MPFPTTVKIAPLKLVIVVVSLIRDIKVSVLRQVAISTKFALLLQVDDAVGILAGIKSRLSPFGLATP
jgi:hypothetical protein